MINLTDQDILIRLSAFEDAFVERKTANDSRDWLKTVVAFANSAPVGNPTILFIGVRDNGEIEGNNNLDSLQRTLSEKLAVAYPPIYYLPKVLQQDGKQFLAVIVPGSEDRPHFAGQAFVREGSKTVPSSERQFETLIAERNSKVREILKWKSKPVTVRASKDNLRVVYALGSEGGTMAGTVTDCNQFYLTLESLTKESQESVISIPLHEVEINFDHREKRLELRLRG
jgi:predicted HTH transcriptional regulator